MSKKATATNEADRKRVGKANPLTGDEVKTRLKEKGLTLKKWASQRGYPYETVSAVVRGINRGTYGMGHRIATELGMK